MDYLYEEERVANTQNLNLLNKTQIFYSMAYYSYENKIKN